MVPQEENYDIPPLVWMETPSEGGGRCPACSDTRSRCVAVVRSYVPKLRALPLNRCEHCGSLFFEGEDVVVSYMDSRNNEFEWRHYAEVGASIDSMLRTLHCVELPANGSLLDVGCGMGFVVDYWTRMNKGVAIGLEKATYGAIGRDVLSADVRPEYLGESPDLVSKTFDIVYSSEVIEHVTTPREFLAEMSRAVADQGLLILTTPSADASFGDMDEVTALSVLCPGAHYFLLSEKALIELLHSVGFDYVSIMRHGAFGEQLVAVASRYPFESPSLERMQYETYREYLVQLSGVPDRSIKSGALYRLLREDLNRGRLEEAVTTWGHLLKVADEAYGLDLYDPPLKQALTNNVPKSYFLKYPAWMACIQYYAGILASHSLDDIRSRLNHFDAATRLLRHEVNLGAQFAREASSLIEASDFHFLQAAAFVIMLEGHYLSGTLVRPGESVTSDYWRSRWTNEVHKLREAIGSMIGISPN